MSACEPSPKRARWSNDGQRDESTKNAQEDALAPPALMRAASALTATDQTVPRQLTVEASPTDDSTTVSRSLTAKRPRSEDTPFRCDICQKDFRLRDYLRRHQLAHTGEYPYVCKYPDCARRFRYASSLLVHHCESAEAIVAEHPCTFPGCERVFAKASTLAQHLRRHVGCVSGHACRTCGQEFNDMSNRNAHERRHRATDTGQRPFPCQHPGCTKAFTQAVHLRSHQSAHAAAQRPALHRCTYAGCDKAYTEASSLNLHQRTKGHRVASKKPALAKLAHALPLVALASMPSPANPEDTMVTVGERQLSNEPQATAACHDERDEEVAETGALHRQQRLLIRARARLA